MCVETKQGRLCGMTGKDICREAYPEPEDGRNVDCPGLSAINPLMGLDYPDPDIIRVGDTYYMVSTSMHFMPGCEILRSYDLVNWEHAVYVYDTLDGTPEQKMDGEHHIYGKGMWAASLRFHGDMFYVCFAANDTGKTYLYTADAIAGPWKKQNVEGFYHDGSLLFDEGKVYIAYGNSDIYITQLKPDLSGPLPGGLHRLAVSDAGNPQLGYEGAHFYKIEGRYYLFLIHSLRDRWMRTQACFVSDSIDGEFTGGDVLEDDRGYCGQGVAQGGIVDTPDQKWYAVLFQDYGAAGRIPVLVPVAWKEGYPVFGAGGKIPGQFGLPHSEKPGYGYRPLVQSDDFRKEQGLSAEQETERFGCYGFRSVWQFSHEPDLRLVGHDGNHGILWMETGKLCKNLLQAKNILTQRMLYPACAGEITVDVCALKEGDYAGICALQGCYGMVAVTKRADGHYEAVMKSRTAEDDSLSVMSEDMGEGTEWESVPVERTEVRLKVDVDFGQQKDEARFFYHTGSGWKKIGITQKLYFKLDHFTGCRFGLFVYATKETGGRAGFRDFQYRTVVNGWHLDRCPQG